MSGTDDSSEQKQELFRVEQPVGFGVDEYGEYALVPLSMLRGGRLRETKVHSKPMKHIINTSHPDPRGWYKNKHENDRTRPRPCYSEALLTTPYGGYCPVGCAFCYVDNGTRGYRSTGLATASPDYPEHMAKQLAKIMTTGPAYMSSFTEPFQLLEGRHHVTQRLSQVFNDNGLPFFYLSRKIPPDWAVDALLVNPYSYMQFSINSSDNKLYKRLSPGSFKIDEIMETIRKMSEKGIYISIQCNPVMPGIMTQEDILTLIGMLGQAGAHHIIFKFAEQVFNQRQLLLDRLMEHKVPRVDAFDAVFTQKIGGVYTVAQDLRVEWLNAFLEKTRQVGMTMSTCYEYYDDGKAGANLAPYFTTSDQCHGRGVPVHARPAPNEPFVPLPGCYRKGCLYCEEYGTKACRNEELLQAKALQFSDMKRIVIDPKLLRREKAWGMKDSCARPEDARQSVHGNPGLKTDMEMREE